MKIGALSAESRVVFSGRNSWRVWVGVAALIAIWVAIRLTTHPQIKVVYLVPKDLSPRPDFPDAARRAVKATQRWYFDELEQGKTFALADPLVDTVVTKHPEVWYRTVAGTDADRERLWRAAIDEAFQLTGGSYDDGKYVWIYFLDANLPAVPAQGTNGVTLLLRDEIVKLIGPEARCDTVGTVAHEMGHAFGLVHPPDCDSHKKDDSDPECESMSYLGELEFPRVHYLPDERFHLLRHPSFIEMEPEARDVSCTMQGTSR